jgi:hypothetical protein
MDQNENPPSRWTTDPGAIPGEPYDYLDIPIGEDGEIDEAKALIAEIDTPGGSRWEAMAFGGKSLGLFETAEQARTAAEKHIDEVGWKKRRNCSPLTLVTTAGKSPSPSLPES